MATNLPSTRWIRVRAALLTLILVAVSLVAVGAYSHWVLRQTLIHAGEIRATGLAAQLASAVGSPIPLRLAEIQRLADDERVRAAVTAPSPAAEAAAFERLLPIAANVTLHQTLELWDSAGRRVAARRIPDDGDVALSSEPPTTTGILPYADHGDGVIVLEVVVGIRPADGSAPLGFVRSRRVAINPNATDTVSRLVGDGGRVLIGNQDGTIWSDTTQSVTPPAIPPNTPGLHRYAGEDGVTRVAGVAHPANTPFAVLVEFPEHLFVAPATAVLRQVALGALFFVLAAAAVVWRISARVTKPIDELTDALRSISEGDFSRRVEVAPEGEVAKLGATFNAMAEKIQAGLAALEQRAEELREKDRRKAAMMNAALDAIITTDSAGRVTDSNPAAARVFGYAHADFVGRDFRVLLGLPGSADYAGLEDYAAQAGTLRLGAWQEWTAQRSDGTTFPAEATVVPITTDGLQGFAAFVRDLTSQKAAEQSILRGVILEEENRRVQEASRMKSEFLANMSHELRTPLNAIIGFAELLHDGQVTPDMPEFRDFLHDILNSGRHLLQLINDVLDLSKVEAGRLEFHPEDTNLDAIVAESIAILRTLSAQKRVAVSSRVDPAIGTVFVDRSRLKQVLYNYLSNAIKFTPAEGRIDVAVTAHGDGEFRVEVTDTGIGIAAEDLAKLFLEFNQLEAGAAKQHQGTGLGLALTKRLVEAQGGTVGVRSTLGEGSTFTAILPRRATRGTPLADPRSIPAKRIGAPSVLVIEDDAADQDAIVRILTGAGFSVETANSRAQALVKLTAQTFDAVTLDLILPDAGGADVLRDIRGSQLNADVPVVVITIVAQSGAVGGFAVHDILAKPVDATDVLRALERAGVSATAAGSVLIVDDDPGSLRLMAASLQQLGYRSRLADGALEGLRLCEQEPPLAVVLDLQMPEVDGFGFLERFRRMPACADVPVIVWTVKDLGASDVDRLRASVQGIMAKGQGTQTVVDELRRFVVQRQP